MNSLSKEDALVLIGVPIVKHLSKLDAETRREVASKKRKPLKAVRSRIGEIAKV